MGKIKKQQQQPLTTTHFSNGKKHEKLKEARASSEQDGPRIPCLDPPHVGHGLEELHAERHCPTDDPKPREQLVARSDTERRRKRIYVDCLRCSRHPPSQVVQSCTEQLQSN